ncbi:molybdenum ABC transporter permease [Psychromonas sp. PRT-SC03]|nr:molybdenum ABC transporter permease [Psychromonas sp. PRT-SC03]
MTELDISAIYLTFKLATSTTFILLLISPPLSWWLARSQRVYRPFIESLVALPLVLPPTVLGFYLLLAFSPDSYIGALWVKMTGSGLAFSFSGLLIASIIYSLPFVVQPLQSAFINLDKSYLEVASTLGFSAQKTFYKVVFPMTLPSFIIAGALGFAHTIGEFGVVLMIGGNIPGETQVLSIALFDHVETLEYAQAHLLSLLLLGFSMFLLMFIYAILQKRQKRLNHA